MERKDVSIGVNRNTKQKLEALKEKYFSGKSYSEVLDELVENYDNKNQQIDTDVDSIRTINNFLAEFKEKKELIMPMSTFVKKSVEYLRHLYELDKLD